MPFLVEPPRIEYHVPHVMVEACCPWQPELVIAVWEAEGSHRARRPFGVLSIPVRSRAHAREITVNSIQAAWRRFNDAGQPGGNNVNAFIIHMGLRWCPPSVDPVGYRRWVSNMQRIVARELAKRPVYAIR